MFQSTTLISKYLVEIIQTLKNLKKKSQHFLSTNKSNYVKFHTNSVTLFRFSKKTKKNNNKTTTKHIIHLPSVDGGDYFPAPDSLRFFVLHVVGQLVSVGGFPWLLLSTARLTALLVLVSLEYSWDKPDLSLITILSLLLLLLLLLRWVSSALHRLICIKYALDENDDVALQAWKWKDMKTGMRFLWWLEMQRWWWHLLWHFQ